MHQRIFAYVFCFFTASFLYAQDVDSYIRQLEYTPNDQEKLAVMDSILSKTFRTDTDLFVTYSLEYITLAKELEEYTMAAKKAMNLQYSLTIEKKDPHKSISVINGVLSHKYKIKDSFLLGGLYLKRGGAHIQVNIDKAIEDYGLALKNLSQKDSIYIADVYLFRGQAYSSVGDFIAGGKDFKSAYDIYESLEDYEYMLHAQQGNVNMFSMNGFFEKAEVERKKRIEKLKELDLKQYLSGDYLNQSLDHGKQGNRKKQLEFLELALDYLQYDEEFSERAISVHAELVEFYSTVNDFEAAEPYLEYLAAWKKLDDKNSFANMFYHSALSQYELHKGNLGNALSHAKLKLKNAERLGLEEEKMEAYQILAQIYNGKGDYEKGIQNQYEYIAIKDSIFNRSNANALAYYQTLYEAEKQDKQLVEKNTDIKILESNNSSFRRQMFFFSLATLFLFGVMILFRNRKHLKQNKRLQERFSQELLVSQEDERKRISKDLHDGIGQRLLLIKNKLIQNNDEDTKWMVDNAIDEVRAISRDLHPFQLQEMGLTRALQHTITQIDENTTLFITSEIDNIDNLFRPEQEVNIYRIVQESFNNILKHAKAEASRISVKNLSNHVIISIKDNGIGFESSEKLNDVKSLGLKTIMERTKFLDGQMRIHSVKNNGTTLEFQFPLK